MSSEVQYQLPQLNKACMRCPDLVKSRKRITWGYGSPTSSVIFIGEAPGYAGCDISGIPFTGDPSGNLFQEMLHSVDWTKEDVYVCNIVCCCPFGNRTPTDIEIDNCSIYLEYQITKINPQYIILLGGPAIKHFFPHITKVINVWDKIVESNNYPGKKFILLPHPAWICRNRHLKSDYINSFRKIKIITS